MMVAIGGVRARRAGRRREPPRPRAAGKARSLVLGLGNPILCDDAVGILVAREVERRLVGRRRLDVDVRDASVAGFDLLDLLSGYERAILVDAIRIPDGRPGTIHRLLPEQLPVSERIAATHEINLSTALALGKMLGIDMPGEVVIYAIEVQDDRTFGETLSPTVRPAVRLAAARVVRELETTGR